MTTLDVLISTCNHRIVNLSHMNLLPYANVRYLVIHQVFSNKIDEEKIKCFKSEISQRADIEIHLMSEQGLSKSRNAALAKSTADICLISDDDVIYLTEAIPKIIEVFDQYPEQDIIGFKMLNPDDHQPVRQYPDVSQHPLTQMTSFYSAVNFWSPEIAFRRKSVLDKKVLFSQKIGLGTAFPVGEEALFLADCFHQHLNIACFDLPICILPNSSTGDREDLPMYFIRGVVWSQIFGVAAIRWQMDRHLTQHSTWQDRLKLGCYLVGSFYYILNQKWFRNRI